MFYIALGLSISLTNLSAPFSCLAQLFCWRNANEVILHESAEGSTENRVPETIEEMRKLISEMKKDPQSQDQDVSCTHNTTVNTELFLQDNN